MDGDAVASADRPGGGEIRTFLIADVRGYTAFTQEHGDEAAARLTAKFAAIVRTGVTTRNGSLVDLRGDEALAVFSSARQAIRAALDLQSAFVAETIIDPSLPLAVGIGLDAGEAVPVEEGYRGGALNLAARLCSRAGPGETLASQEVVHFARKVEGVRFVERRAIHLKGLDQPVVVVRVMLEEGDPAERLAGVLLARPRRWHLRYRRRSIVLVAAVAAAVVVAGTLVFLPHGSSAGPALATNGIQVINAKSGHRVGTVALSGPPSGLTFGDGAVWVSEPQAGSVLRIDPNTLATVDTIPVGQGPAGIAFGDGAAWVALSGDRELARIDPATDSFVKVSVGNGPTGVAVAGRSVWVTNFNDDTVVRVDATTNRVVGKPFQVGIGPVAVAADARGAWVADSGDATVTRIPLGGQGTSTIPVGNGPSGIALGATAVWVTNRLDGTVSRIDRTNKVVTAIPIGDGPTGLTVDAATVWIGDQFTSAVVRVNTTTRTVSPATRLQARPDAVTLVGGDLWVAASAANSQHRGGTLRFAGTSPVSSIDPAVAYDIRAAQILSLTNDGLVGFARVAGPQGGAIVADLATSVPTPTNGGTTYSFQLRPGLHYSDGAPVEPEDFRLGIERTLLDAPSFPASYYSGIVGATSCKSQCDLTKGIVTSDSARTVTFHLTRPDPEFIFVLGLNFADAVPSGTPLKPISTKHPLPATGPYMIESYQHTPLAGKDPKGTIELVRNPRFVQWSEAAQPAGYPDRIVGRYGVTPAQEVSGVEQAPARPDR